LFENRKYCFEIGFIKFCKSITFVALNGLKFELMNFMKPKTFVKKAFLFVVFANLTHASCAQKSDSTKAIRYFAGGVYATNNGLSLFPNFSLGKPAAVFNMAMGGKKLTFEPEFRFSMEGKPWSFLFWWRYKMIKTDRFAFNIGAHPAIAFKTKTVMVDGLPQNVLIAQRFLAAEAFPNYALTKNINVGLYYLHSYGLETDVTQHTNFVALRGSFSNISLSNDVFLRFAPQFYYLQMDAKDGFYMAATTSLTKKNVPFYLSSIVSQSLRTNIPGNDFVWNISLHYAFNQKYSEL
jgi:hypothetical protein